ncbi:MAG: hypothetical protein FWD31_12110 [Planctomycetaceae bacterium]|nr:hypothetical protein [Planctomycetaceae bacterium]
MKILWDKNLVIAVSTAVMACVGFVFVIFMTFALFFVISNSNESKQKIQDIQAEVQHIQEIEADIQRVNEENKKVNEEIRDILREHGGDISYLNTKRIEQLFTVRY